jgi:thioredoxin 2
MATATSEVIVCPACGAKNRVSAEKLSSGLAPVCGRCKSSLSGAASAGGVPITVTDATFASLVEISPLPVVVDLWAAWCGPCRLIAPVIDRLAAKMAGKVTFAKLNIDENPGTANRFRVESIPTLLVMKGGREVDRIIGMLPEAEIAQRVERLS